MCGICGVIGVESIQAGELTVRRMMDAMRHRGPDGEGMLLVPPVAAGMRRLAIIDLPGGNQPVWNETKTLATVFNGEIYNFRELRKELENAGHRFRTRSDTEVIVHAYEEWGERCVQRLRGMFAFAIVETPQGPASRATHVFLARDRLGIKPLCYAFVDGKLFFASEVRALLASGEIPARLAPEAIPAYLLFGSVCEPSTLVEGVASLPPGHSLRIALDELPRSVAPISYWDARGANETITHAHVSLERISPTQEVRSLLTDAVTSHLVADVPVGVFLSGGIDSTAIAALASEAQSGIHTFTVAFPDAEFSEAEQARRTARLLGTEHRELMLSDHDMITWFDDALNAFDQPSMDGINTFFVSWAARQAGLKVALSGLGSDEIFGGYTSFRAKSAVAYASVAGRLSPHFLRRFGGSVMDLAASIWTSPDRLRKASSAFQFPDLFPDPYFFTRLLFTPGTFAERRHRGSASWETLSWWHWLRDASSQSKSMDGFTRVSWLELRSYLLNTLLRDTDAVSMRNSLEVRVPFLDGPLVEYVLSLPETVKMPSKQPKGLLIAALADILPSQVVSQRKRTFTFPWQNWLRGALGKRVAAGLAEWSPNLEPELGVSFALGVWRDFLNGRTTWSRPWSLYMLNEWVKRNLRSDQTHAAGFREPAAVA
ncbi:MAG TPA: asparagine synthase (glutamine-hydrolyzing) [Candidatus Acidoferrales bacterium]|nr:asparagine synthase (glutamine-hydrolyzing) [Candidatus Acidoferrales bacterium]